MSDVIDESGQPAEDPDEERPQRKYFTGNDGKRKDITHLDLNAEESFENFGVLPKAGRNRLLQSVQDQADCAVQEAREAQATKSVECIKRLDAVRDTYVPVLDEMIKTAAACTQQFLDRALHEGHSPTTALRQVSRVQRIVKTQAELEKILATPPIVHVEDPKKGGKVQVNVGAGVYMGAKQGPEKPKKG